MKQHETRRCLNCGSTLHVVEGSDKTVRNKVYFKLRCRNCGREEMDWYERPHSFSERTLNSH